MVCAAEIIWDNSGHLLNVCLIQLYVSKSVFVQVFVVLSDMLQSLSVQTMTCCLFILHATYNEHKRSCSDFLRK